MEFVVDEPYLTKPGLSLLFQLRTQSTIGPDKDIGAVTVSVHDLFRPDSAAADRTVDHQVITPSGKSKGTLKFAYKFGDKFTHQVAEPKRAAEEPVTAYPPPPQYAYPPAQQHPGYGYGGYPTTSGYGQGYPAAPPAGYAAYAQPQKPKKNRMGGGLGLGLGAGLLGGLLVGDIGESAAYADGYGDAMGDMGDFDF
ncbi:hypothetical protein SASPL_102671 [Salvia splendens]|nr:hypothetical protein SASPL_102671 [Salvia splendens]